MLRQISSTEQAGDDERRECEHFLEFETGYDSIRPPIFKADLTFISSDALDGRCGRASNRAGSRNTCFKLSRLRLTILATSLNCSFVSTRPETHSPARKSATQAFIGVSFSRSQRDLRRVTNPTCRVSARLARSRSEG